MMNAVEEVPNPVEVRLFESITRNLDFLLVEFPNVSTIQANIRRLLTPILGPPQLLPPSNPRNWPHSSEADIQDNPSRSIYIGHPQKFSFVSNFVKTSKFEIYNFLPKFLLIEFHFKTKIANCYFLLIAVLECVPQISNTGGYPTTLIPLLFVVCVDAIFQILDDLARHRADHKANISPTTRYNRETKQFETCQWLDLQVGDLVRIATREALPADVLVLSVAEKTPTPQGICYVETKSLDGETNLKIRSALPSTLAKIKGVGDLASLTGEIEMEHPNKLVNSFTGVIHFYNIGRESIQPNNLLLRGCVLRNTDWIIGIVVNTGHDTKVMMSSSSTRTKTSKLEALGSGEITKIIVLLAAVCFAGATGQALWNSYNDVSTMWYLSWDPSPIGNWFVSFFRFFLLHATFVPVSLYVSMSMVRFFQAYFMNNDLEMYYEKTDTPALVRTMTLNEELGQITHIFSDKTGTLTCNVMDFRKASINGVSYGRGITEIGKAAWKLQGIPIDPEVMEGEAKARANAVPHVSFYCPDYERDMRDDPGQHLLIQQFFRVLAVCHDVIPEHVNGSVKLSASNPDDEALVCAAGFFGFQFRDRREKYCVVHNKKTGMDESIEVLSVIEFSSKRKRMTVIIRDIDGVIKILCKGADTAITPRLHEGQDEILELTEKDMVRYSIEGLRCLYIGAATIPEDQFKKWSKAYFKATTDLNEIDKKKKGLPNKIEDLEDDIEMNLSLLGATAIEDRLQDGVPECIAQLVEAGLVIWVLTGDKEETAINIAVACNLVLPKEYMDHIIINNHNAGTAEALHKRLQMEIKSEEVPIEDEEAVESTRPRALIIDGQCLLIAMADRSPNGLREQLLLLSQQCKAVVGCRVSPDQKKQMVDLVKTGVDNVRALSIGDGANDVAMIQEAHIGVGIKGEEGLQAVNAADFAIAQFCYLSKLMLKHGRYNYLRTSSLICYIFYKNILMSVGQFWFNFTCAFSGQKYYTEGAIQLYNLMFTSLPILLFAIYDKDVDPSSVEKYPRLYEAGMNDEFFKPSLFWYWIVSAGLESILLSVLPLYTLSNNDLSTGNDETFTQAGATCLTAVVIIVNLKIFFVQSRWHWIHGVVIFGSIGVYFGVISFINAVKELDYNFYTAWNRLLGTSDFWLTLFLLVVTALGKEVHMIALERSFAFRPFHIVQELEGFPKPMKGWREIYFWWEYFVKTTKDVIGEAEIEFSSRRVTPEPMNAT